MADNSNPGGTTPSSSPIAGTRNNENIVPPKSRNKPKDKDKDAASNNKRRCVSTACIACRRRKSKCDGNLPKCAACASVYLTECEYAPHTDHRRKGVYKKDNESLKTKNLTLQVLVQALLNAEEEEDAFDLVRQIRTCDNLEDLAQAIENKERGIMDTPDSPIYGNGPTDIPQFEAELSGRMGDLVLDGSVKFIGGTSNLIWLNDSVEMASTHSPAADGQVALKPKEQAILGWTTVTQDKDLILHFMNMYFCWHYAYFTTLSKELFYRDFLTGTESQYCSALLVNVMLALGCHFSSRPTARSHPEDSATTGDHFFAEAKRLLHADNEFEVPKLCTVQALALMSVREAGCGRESTGWIYSGMSFRLASDLGLNVDSESIDDARRFSDEDVDARRITFWGCFLFDKCWSNYLGRQPQILLAHSNVQKPDVFGSEDSEFWSPYTDSGIVHTNTQPARTRAVSLQIFKLAEMSSDLLTSFYQPQHIDRHISKQGELKRLSDIHTRLEAWRKDLPPEMEAKDGQLPQVLLMHMFYQLLYIHLYRPFLKYTKATSPLPSHISPRKFCTQAASAISKLFRLYKRTHGLRQICNIAVYIAHSACTIHLLNLPEKNARRDIIHGVKQLEEIGEFWTCARRTLRILGKCADKWRIELPEEAEAALHRASQRWSEAGLSPVPLSPDTVSAASLHLQSQQISDILARNWQQHAQTTPHTGPDTTYVLPNMTTAAAQSILAMASASEKQPDVRYDMPTSFEPTVGQNTNNPKFSINLTKAQQDAWNALQAKLGHITPTGARTPKEQPANAAVVFGGINSLMEESQEWWYNDQSQLAMGFDNWNTPSSSDWNPLGGNGNVNGNGNMSMAPPDSGVHITSNHNSQPFLSQPQVHNRMEQMLPPSSPATSEYPKPSQQQQQQHHLQALQQQQAQQHAQSMSVSPPAHRIPRHQPVSRSAQKRTSAYDDDDLMY